MKRLDERTTALIAHGGALLRLQAMDLALDREQGVDALDRRDRNRRLLQPCELEELAPSMRPAADLDDRPGLTRRLIEPVEAGIGIRLHRSRVARKMGFRMLAGSVGRVEERGCGWRMPGEWPVVAHIGPHAAGTRLALGQNRHGRIVGMDALACEDVRLDRLDQRHQRCSSGADPVGERGHIEWNALVSVGRALPVERQMQPVFGKQDVGEQSRAGAAARNGVEGCRRLGDRLAGPAGELLAHVLDHLPLPRNELQRLRHVLADLAQPVAPAARAIGRDRIDDTLAWQVLGQRPAGRSPPLERTHLDCLGLSPLGCQARGRFGFRCILFELGEFELELIER